MTRDDITVRDGWCCCHHSCGGVAVAVPVIVRPRHAESCVRCVARLLGLPEDTGAEAVVAELWNCYGEKPWRWGHDDGNEG